MSWDECVILLYLSLFSGGTPPQRGLQLRGSLYAGRGFQETCGIESHGHAARGEYLHGFRGSLHYHILRFGECVCEPLPPGVEHAVVTIFWCCGSSLTYRPRPVWNRKMMRTKMRTDLHSKGRESTLIQPRRKIHATWEGRSKETFNALWFVSALTFEAEVL